MVDFAGWWMPVQYTGLKEEHLNVRQHVGLFDVSHMGEIRVQGPKSLETLQWLTSNDVAKLQSGEAQYSLLPNNEGGLVDDIIVYCLKPGEDYLVCVNASNKDKDWQWMQANNRGAILTDESERWAQIAVQGPQALALLDQVTGLAISGMKPFHFAKGTFANAEMIVATTGYTGEKGGEVFIEKAGAVALWQALLEKGKAFNVMPIGLGARDTLRTEMKYSLYGHEIDDHSNPFEAELGWVVKPAKKDFLGKDLIVAAKRKRPKPQIGRFQNARKGHSAPGLQAFV